MCTFAGYGKTMRDESFRETTRHGSEEYPFQYYLEDIWLFDFHCIDWHWHPEVEFVFLEQGTAEFLVGNQRHILNAGTGIFINSQVIHRFEATESAQIPNIVFSPFLLAPEESLIFQKYMRPVLDSPVECLVFSQNHLQQREILNKLCAVFAVQEAAGARELKTVELLLGLWEILCELPEISGAFSAPRPRERGRARLQIMLQYIHKNYPHPISLDDIAGAVALSKSSVLSLFRQTIHTSPVSYLLNYRLKQAAKLLAATENNVSAIAEATGFESTGYFCRKFKEAFQVTPSEYRRKAARGIALLEAPAAGSTGSAP